MAEKILNAAATKKNVLATKKKLYKKPVPIKFIQRDNRFKGTCLFCGPQVGWNNPACGRG